jgi:hypothetical protein
MCCMIDRDPPPVPVHAHERSHRDLQGAPRNDLAVRAESAAAAAPESSRKRSRRPEERNPRAAPSTVRRSTFGSNLFHDIESGHRDVQGEA